MTYPHQNIITEEFDTKAVYQLVELPKKGNLFLNGQPAQLNMLFTQGDIRNGNLSYTHTSIEPTNLTETMDTFKFKVPINEIDYLNSSIPRNNCMPPASIPKDGIFTYYIQIGLLPAPVEIRNEKITIMEDQTSCLGLNTLFYSSDTAFTNKYFGNPNLIIQNTQTQNFGLWERFYGTTVFENPSALPPWELAAKWEIDYTDKSIFYPGNSGTVTGLVSPRSYEDFIIEATMSSTDKDDDEIYLVIAYVQQNGVPRTLSIARGGGGMSNLTWGIVSWNGTTRSVLSDQTSKAPVPYPTGKSGWNKLGKTRVRVKRQGNTLTCWCSQFSGLGPNGEANPATEIDESTKFTFSVPSIWSGPQPYGFASYSQANARLSDMLVTEIPPNSTEEEAEDEVFEKFPIEYTVTSFTGDLYGKYQIDGTDVKVGDKFDHSMIKENRLCVVGQDFISGISELYFKACNQANKCTGGKITTIVKEWPYPVLLDNLLSITECTSKQINSKNLKFGVDFGSTDSEISISLNEQATDLANKGNGRVTTNPLTFTQQDLNDGNVSLVHNCDTKTKLEYLVFDVCTNHGKCRQFKVPVNVKIVPMPPVPPGLPPYVVLPSLCTYMLNFNLEWVQKGQCGVWIEVGSVAQLPDPTIPGQIAYIVLTPDDKPVSVVTVPDENGNLVWAPTPVVIDSGEVKPEGCPIEEVAPPTEKKPITIDLEMWGDYFNGPPKFAVVNGSGQELFKETVSDLKYKGQKGSQKFKFDVAYDDFLSPLYVVFLNDYYYPEALKPGLDAKYYNLYPSSGQITSFSDYSVAGKTPDAVGVLPSLYAEFSGSPIAPGINVDRYAAVWEGYIQLDKGGAYTFEYSSNDGMRMYLTNTYLALDNDGINSLNNVKTKTVNIAAGLTPVRVEFFDNTAGSGVKIKFSGPATNNVLVPLDSNFLKSDDKSKEGDRNLKVISASVNNKKATKYINSKGVVSSEGNIAINYGYNQLKINKDGTQITQPPYKGGIPDQNKSCSINGAWNFEPEFVSTAVKTEAKSLECFIDEENDAKWITAPDGTWYPVGDPMTQTAIIKATDDFVVVVDDLSEVPVGNTKPVVVKPENNVYTPKPNEDFVKEINQFTKGYVLDQFDWIGPNEFYVKFGTLFYVNFYSNRFYVRFDIMESNGTTLIDPQSKDIADINSSGRLLTTLNCAAAIQKSGSTNLLPLETIWDNVAYTNNYRSTDMDPHKKGSYVANLNGTNYLAGFMTSQAPKQVIKMQKILGGEYYLPGIYNPPVPNENEVWKEPNWVYTYPGKNQANWSSTEDLRWFPNSGAGEFSSYEFVARYGGAQYGTYEPGFHFDEYKRFNNARTSPPSQVVGWKNAYMTLLGSKSINAPKQEVNGGIYKSIAPMAPTTFTFTVRAYDLATGEEKTRTFKIHYTATGTNAKGKKSVTTDAATSSGSKGYLPPKNKVATCVFTDQNGTLGQCIIT